MALGFVVWGVAAAQTAPPITAAQRAALDKNAKAFTGKSCGSMATYQAIGGDATLVKMSYDSTLQTNKAQGVKVIKQQYTAQPAAYKFYTQHLGVTQYTEMLPVNGKYHLALCALKP